MSTVVNQAAFLLDFCRLVLWATEQGYTLTCGEVQRPIEMQKLYVERGSSRTMNSRHLVKMAGDLNIFKNGKLCGRAEIEPLGRYWESLHPKNRWGGNFDRDWSKPDKFFDGPHFERQD